MDAHKNFSYSTVATAPSPATSGTSLVVATGDGAKFPAAPFNATVWPAGAQATTANAEIVRVTAVSTDTLTITRAQESTSARTIVVGDQIQAGITAKTVRDIELSFNLRAKYLCPSGALAETYPRSGSPIASAIFLTSGQLYLTAIALPAAAVISSVTFSSGSTAASSPTHWWYGLYDSNRVQLALTADQLTAAFPATTPKTLAIATVAAGSASTFTTTYEGLYYIGFMMAATSTCSLAGTAVSNQVGAISPALGGSSDGSQTTPPAFPHTATALTVTSGAQPYIYVS